MSGEIIQQQAEPVATLGEQMAYAKAVASAGILPQAYRGRPADVLVAIGLGRSMGLSPMESLYRINVIQGKPTASAELIAAQVRRAGHRLRISKDAEHMSVTATIIRADDPDAPFVVTRDQQWAQQMGLTGKDNYKKQPLTMLTWRAITACAREACPESLYGIAYTPDEMHDLDRTPARPIAPDPDVRVSVDPEPVPAPAPAPSEPAPTPAQIDRITELMREAGVDSADAAAYVLRSLTGRDQATTPAMLTRVDAENLLSSQELLQRRTRQFLDEYKRVQAGGQQPLAETEGGAQ